MASDTQAALQRDMIGQTAHTGQQTALTALEFLLETAPVPGQKFAAAGYAAAELADHMTKATCDLADALRLNG